MVIKNYLSCILFFLLSNFILSQSLPETIVICEDLKLIKITENAYIHISFMPGSEKTPCNGFILTNKDQAFLFDTPVSDSVTIKLLKFIQDNLKLKLIGFISNDWHIDSMGGLSSVIESQIPTYANEQTREIAKSKGLPVHKNGFKDSLKLNLNEIEINCYYPGPAHTMDNIVVWIPSEKILFADCMVKEMKATDLGFVGDGDPSAYETTLQKVLSRYAEAKFVIPGHGNYGGIELINHSIEMAKTIFKK